MTATNTARPGNPHKLRIAQPKGRAASEPQVPGATGISPTPNQVASSTAGCLSCGPRRLPVRIMLVPAARSPHLAAARVPPSPRERGEGPDEGLITAPSSQRQADGGDGLRGDAFAAAGKAEPFGRCRLDADAVAAMREDLPRARSTIAARCGADLRALADQRHVDMRDDCRRGLDRRSAAWRRNWSEAAPRHCGSLGGKCCADIAGADRAEHRVGQRVQPDIGVGMPDEPLRRAALRTPHSMTCRPGPNACTSKPCPTRMSASRAARSALGARQIFRRRHLEIVLIPGDQPRRQPGRLGDRRIVGQFAPGGGAMGRKNGGEMKPLRRLRAPQRGAVDRLADVARR